MTSYQHPVSLGLSNISIEQTPCQDENSKDEDLCSSKWKKIEGNQLNLNYLKDFLDTATSKRIFLALEDEIVYFVGDLAKIRVYGKWHDLPRKQAAYGDEGLKYTYSGCTVSAKPWTSTLSEIKKRLEKSVSYKYNFCLVNRYNSGLDYMGEHRDDEKELDPSTPIASISLGQHRDFIFRHKNSRGKHAASQIPTVKLVLNSGSLLLMNPPTNSYWYHSLPKRKNVPGPRINLTFRRII